MPLVAFDTNTCIWGIKNQSTSGQANMVGLADKLIKVLSKNNVNIMLPAPVVSELLSNLDPTKAVQFYKEITRKFRVGYFDAKATIVLSEILNHHFTLGKYKTLGITKTPMKYDAYIIAIAIASGAEAIYSEDPDFETIAAHFIPVLHMDKLPLSIQRTDWTFPSGQ